MIDAGVGGSIVAVSSISGTVADRDMGAYCVSKAGVNMLVKVAAVEWGGYGIRVNAVGPGVTRTPMLVKPEQLPGWVDGLIERTALGRLGEAADVAGAIVGVLELPWVTGQIVHADGGLALHSPIDAYGQTAAGDRRKRAVQLMPEIDDAPDDFTVAQVVVGIVDVVEAITSGDHLVEQQLSGLIQPGQPEDVCLRVARAEYGARQGLVHQDEVLQVDLDRRGSIVSVMPVSTQVPPLRVSCSASRTSSAVINDGETTTASAITP